MENRTAAAVKGFLFFTAVITVLALFASSLFIDFIIYGQWPSLEQFFSVPRVVITLFFAIDGGLRVAIMELYAANWFGSKIRRATAFPCASYLVFFVYLFGRSR